MRIKKLLILLASLIIVATFAVACTPETMIETVVVEVEVPGDTVIEEVEVQVGGDLVSIVARCKASPPFENGRCDNLTRAVGAANAALAEAGDDRRIDLTTIMDDADWGDYKTEFELASEAGEAPDIIVSGHEHIGDWATAGYLVDLTDMMGDYPEFADVIDSLWLSTELDGSRYGIPQDAEARPLYFSKIILKKLGWTDDEIDALQGRIETCDFTMDDMFDVAEEAVDAGLVAEGNGWWHRPTNGPDFTYFYYGAGGVVEEEGFDGLVFDTEAALKVYTRLYSAAQERGIIRPDKLDGDWDIHKEYTSTFENVLFVTEGTWRWASWHTNYLQDLGGEDYLFENVGYAPIPCQPDGTGEAITLTHPLVYMISSQSEYSDLALLLLSKTTTKELNTDYAIASGHLGVLKSQADYPVYTTAKFLSDTLPLLDYTTFLPNSPYWSAYSEAYYLGIQAVESGDLTPAEAVDVVVAQLTNELGDNIKIIP